MADGDRTISEYLQMSALDVNQVLCNLVKLPRELFQEYNLSHFLKIRCDVKIK